MLQNKQPTFSLKLYNAKRHTKFPYNPGQTWKQWIKSEFNTIGLRCDGGYIRDEKGFYVRDPKLGNVQPYYTIEPKRFELEV